MSFNEIPYVKLTGDQKENALQILGRGNVLLKKWAVYYPAKKYRQFRNAVMSGNKNPDNKIPEDKHREFLVEIPLILAIRKRYDFLDNRSTEEAILQGYSAMAKKHARKWANGIPAGYESTLSFKDYLQEAYMQVIEAMYSWLPEHKVDIGTYIFWTLKNRMSNVANQQGNTFRLTNDDLKLVSRYEKAKREMSVRDRVSFDEIVEQLQLTKEEGKALSGLLAQVYSESRILKSEDSEESDSDNDYTGYRTDISRVTDTDKFIQEQHVADTLRRAGLNDIEKEIITVAMNPYRGWQTEFAKNHVNPGTNKPYSRMRVTQILQIAQGKVQRAMGLSCEAKTEC